MKVELLQHSSLEVCAHAIRTCWESFDKSTPEADRALVDRVGNKYKHSSTLEHLTYTFFIDGISRAVLQELARHRMASPSVKSTRYTLKELVEERSFVKDFRYSLKKDAYIGILRRETRKRASKYLVMTKDDRVNFNNIIKLDMLRVSIQNGISNDIAKYELPEAYKTSLTLTINARSLQNFISLRTSKAALWEIRDLARNMFESLPEEHKYLFDNSLSE